MNTVSVLFLFSFFVCLALGLYVLNLNLKGSLNKTFFALCLSLCIWGASFAFMIVAPDMDTALFWRKAAAFGFIPFYAIFLHFCLLLTGYGKRWLFPLLYLPALIFLLERLLLETITPNLFIKMPWGWNYVAPQTNIFRNLFDIYVLTYTLSGFFLVYLWGRRSQLAREKKQSLIIVITGMISFLLGLVTDILPYYLDIILPPLGIVILLICIIGMWVAITKYNLMTITTTYVAEHILKTMSDPVLLFGLDGSVKISNNAALEILGYNEDEIKTKTANELFATDNTITFRDQPEAATSEENLIVTRDGRKIPVRNAISLIGDENNTNRGLVYVIHDITQLKLNEQALQKAHYELEGRLKTLNKIIDESINNIFITDYEGTIEYANFTFEKTTGYSREEVIGGNPRILSSGEVTKAQYKDMWDTIKSGKTWRSIYKNKRKDDQLYWCNSFISPIKNDQEQITHFMAIQEDITREVLAKEQLRYLSDNDMLTGILNRAHFVESLNQYLTDYPNPDNCGVLIHLNIDGFGLINDSFGYIIGDRILKEFAEFLKAKAVEMDMIHGAAREALVGRLGGDDFAVFLMDRNSKEGIKSAETIGQAVRNHRFLNEAIRMTVSMGIVVCPDHGENSSELLSKVNAATLTAKELGKSRYYIYDDDKDYLQEAQSAIEEKLRIITAIENNFFEPWFQPIMNIKSKEIHHHEALARLVWPDGKIMTPDTFISTAENSGLIADIDRIIISKSIKTQSDLSRLGKKMTFSMNLSGKYLGDNKMLDFIQQAIKDTASDPQFLVFEITETAAIHNLQEAATFVKTLKKMGCKFAIDDFGVGFTSFVYLIEMPIDFLKIDGTFIRRLPESTRDQVLVKTIADMSKSLGIETVAEFVDSEPTLKILQELGVDYAQGYLIGKPKPNLKT